MIALQVHARTGHYSLPGPIGQSHLGATFPICPPSTIKGFLESLVGQEYGTFKGEFAYGWIQPPKGHCIQTRKAHVWASGGMKDDEGKATGEKIRQIQIETLFDMIYCIVVRGAWEARIRASLAGECERYGVLYLGESYDLVSVVELATMPEGVKWVVPGTSILLPTQSGRGYTQQATRYGLFDLREGEEPAFLSLGE